MSMDISNFYIHTALQDYQYMRFHINMVPQEIINKYNLNKIVEPDRYCYTEIRKAMYGLKESAFFANKELKRILALEGYVPAKFTPGLFVHKTQDIAFSLVVDNFGIKYINKKDAKHLLETIQQRFPVKAEWEPTFYLGITLEWDWKNQTCKLLMPGYVKQALLKFNHVLQQACYSPSP